MARPNFTPEFKFDDATGRYRHIKTGRFVTGEQVRIALDTYLATKQAEGRSLSEQLQRREVTIAQWQEGLEERMLLSHLAAGAAAKGGWAQMTPATYGLIGRLLRDEYKYLNEFAKQIEQGLPLDGRFLQRADQYLHAPRATFHEVEGREMEARGYDEEISDRHASDSCSECIAIAAKKWVRIRSTPEPGQRKCRRRCKCRKRYRKSARARRLERERKLQATQNPAAPVTASFPDSLPSAELRDMVTTSPTPRLLGLNAKEARPELLKRHQTAQSKIDQLDKGIADVEARIRDLFSGRSGTIALSDTTTLLKEMEGLKADRKATNAQRLQSMWEVLYANNGSVQSNVNIAMDSQLTRGQVIDTQAGLDLGFRFIGPNLNIPADLAVRPTLDIRAYFKDNTIHASSVMRPDDAVHELGHWIEENNPEVLKQMQDFLARRTAGFKPEKLHKRPNDGFGDDEEAIEDNFVDLYIGKIYPGRSSTEVLTMGMQYFARAPQVLASKDPEMFELIYDVLRGV